MPLSSHSHVSAHPGIIIVDNDNYNYNENYKDTHKEKEKDKDTHKDQIKTFVMQSAYMPSLLP